MKHLIGSSNHHLHTMSAALAVVALCGAAWGQGQAAPEKERETSPKDPVQALTERVQALERSLIAKDAQIQDLTDQVQAMQQKLDAMQPRRGARRMPPGADDQAQGAPFGPGGRIGPFQVRPEDMQEFQRRMDEFMRRNLDDWFEDDGWERDPFALRRPVPQPRARHTRKPRLGVVLAPASAEMRAKYRNDVESGAFVTEVQPGSVAEKAGIMAGDCITSFDNTPITGSDDLVALIRTAPGGSHNLGAMRRGEAVTFTVELGELIQNDMENFRREDNWLRRGETADRQTREVLEVRCGALTYSDELAAHLSLDEKQKAAFRDALAKHTQALNDAYAARLRNASRQEQLAAQQDLGRMAENEIAAAEKSLEGILGAAQITRWREWRRTHDSLSVSRSMQIIQGGDVQGEELGF